MHRTTKDDLKDHLLSLGLQKGHNVWVQARLLSFGLIEGGVQTVYEALREIIGDEGTIAVSTYRLEAPSDEPYDPLRSPSINMGPLSEYIRQLPHAIRSACPLHSHAAIGPLAQIFTLPKGTCSLGPGSDFEQLAFHQFKNLYLGIAHQFHDAATFPVHVQAEFGQIPYREWLDLPRIIKRDGKPVPIIVRYYGRIKNSAKEDLSRAKSLLEEAGCITISSCPYGESCYVDLTSYYDVIIKALRKDPLIFLAERNQGR